MADELENVVEENEETEETPVSEIPYPEGTAPPEYDPVESITPQFTLVEAVIQGAGDIDDETKAEMRKGTAKEAMEILTETEYSGLAEALSAITSEASAPIPEPFTPDYPHIHALQHTNDGYIVYYPFKFEAGNKKTNVLVSIYTLASNGTLQYSTTRKCPVISVPIDSVTTTIVPFETNSYGSTSAFIVTFSQDAPYTIDSAEYSLLDFEAYSKSTEAEFTLEPQATRQVSCDFKVNINIVGEITTHDVTLGQEYKSVTQSPEVPWLHPVTAGMNEDRNIYLLEYITDMKCRVRNVGNSSITIAPGDLVGGFSLCSAVSVSGLLPAPDISDWPIPDPSGE